MRSGAAVWVPNQYTVEFGTAESSAGFQTFEVREGGDVQRREQKGYNEGRGRKCDCQHGCVQQLHENTSSQHLITDPAAVGRARGGPDPACASAVRASFPLRLRSS